jgi:hypothetical protein
MSFINRQRSGTPSFRAFVRVLNIKVGSMLSEGNIVLIDLHSSGQKCSALSRLYVSSSVWRSGFKDQLLEEVAKIKIGPPQQLESFMGPVM